MSTNKFGLSRTIESEISLKIRKDAGFGCVICGCGIFEYEHIEPEFAEAKEHNPDCMTLLCESCHGKVTRGFWSKEKVWEAKKNPKTLQVGFSNEFYDFGENMPIINFAGSKLENCEIPIMIHEEPLIRILPPLCSGSPFRITARFYDRFGNLALDIIENEWRAYKANWDVNFSGKTLTIRSNTRNIVLQITANPPNGITINRIYGLFKNTVIKGDSKKFKIINKDGSTSTFQNCIASNCKVGFSFN